MALSRGLRLHQYLEDWLIRSQSQEEAQVNTQAVVDLTQSLGWIINQEKSELTPTRSWATNTILSGFFTYLFLCEILVNCSSIKEVQISQGEMKVTQGSSPLPASLQVGQ